MRKTIYKLKGLMQSKKAVSPVIAVILLIAIAVAASVTVFAYTQGILAGVTQANLVLANAEIVDSTHIKLTFSNTGGTDLIINRIDLEENGNPINTDDITDAVTGELYDDDGGGLPYDTNLLISAGKSVAIIMEGVDADWNSGDIVTVQVWIGADTSGNPAYETDFEL